MFDFFGWKYEYEPYDLKGWIPDFALFGAEEIVVEIKTYNLLKEFDTEKILTALRGTEKWGKEILLLGSTLTASSNTGVTWAGRPAVILGYLGEFAKGVGREFGGEYWFSGAILNYYNREWGFYHEEGCYKDRITGLYEGDHYLYNPDYEEAIELWNKAGNIVQWRGEK